MFRLTAFLLAGLYLAFLIGGADRGQQRFGLRDAPAPIAVVAPAAETEAPAEPFAVAQAPAPAVATAKPAALPQGVAAMPLVDPASFQPDAATEVFSLAAAQSGLVALVPDEAAAAALRPEAGRPDEAGTPIWAVVMAQAVNVRGGPSTGDSVTGRLVLGDEVMMIGEETDGWVQVRVEGDGIEGFVAARFLSPLAGE